jgi:hypothetical protein
MSEMHQCEISITSEESLMCAGEANGRIEHDGRSVYACDPCIAALTGTPFCFEHGKVHVAHLGRPGVFGCPDCVREADILPQQVMG